MATLMNRGISKQAAYEKMKDYATRGRWVELSPKVIFYLLLVILFALIGANKESRIMTKLFAGAVAGMITSEAAGSIVRKFGGDRLKKISLTIDISVFKFSIPAFAIATILVELWLFS